MDRPRTAMVVASNGWSAGEHRGEALRKFLAAWWPWPWDVTVVVEDHATRSFDFVGTMIARGGGRGAHLCWRDIDADFARDGSARPDCISRRDSGVKCYGFAAAVRDFGAEVVLILDDDCYPPADTDAARRGFVRAHLDALAGGPRWVPSIPGFPTRGYPYFEHGDAGPTHVHMGTWRQVPDLDAPQALAEVRAGKVRPRGYAPPRGARLLHPDQYAPICGMNLSFRAEALPLLYFPKMGEGSPYRRFDDIWAGVILQRCCRHLGWRVSVGDPAVRHVRASDAMRNLEKEAAGIAANERFWRAVDAVALPDCARATPAECMRLLAAGLASRPATVGDTLDTYINDLGGYIATWCDLVDPQP